MYEGINPMEIGFEKQVNIQKDIDGNEIHSPKVPRIETIQNVGDEGGDFIFVMK